MLSKITPEHIIASVNKANSKQSKLDSAVLSITGMSGDGNRYLLNNLMSIEGLSYLEVGCWRGSTACSALYKNNFAKALLIDNFSEFGKDFLETDKEWDNGVSIRNDLENNLTLFTNNKCKFIDADFFATDLSEYGKFDVFFYDGCHDFEPQSKALEYAFNNLSDTFLFIVDDYSFPVVKSATKYSLESISSKVNTLYSLELEREEPIKERWWHGLYITLLSKV
jgi:hypothetical protein